MISELWFCKDLKLEMASFGKIVSYLIAYDQLRLLVEENWDGEPACIFWVIGEVDLSDMGEFRVYRIGNGVLPCQFLIGSSKSPT